MAFKEETWAKNKLEARIKKLVDNLNSNNEGSAYIIISALEKQVAKKPLNICYDDEVVRCYA